MLGKEPIQFENFFGRDVDYGFLGADSYLKLSNQEEANLKEGAVLYAVKSNTRVELTEDIGSGGQGKVFRTSLTGFAAKIYSSEERTKFTQKKMEKILQLNNENPNICWPCDILKTNSGVFVGFLMPLFEGKALNYLLTGNPAKVIARHPKYSRLVQVEMILKMLQAFKYLHEKNILVGDIKLENIIYSKGTMDIRLVDMDSVQIGEYNCKHSTLGYDPPEVIQCFKNRRHDEKLPNGKFYYNLYYSDKYRDLDIESYAMSVLIYRFLMEEKCPYTYEDWIDEGFQDGEYNHNELCIKQQFAYGIVEKDTVRTACKKEIWSHFPSFLKGAFVDVFKNQQRYTDEEWIKLFTRYKRLLESGELHKVDPDCMDPFPERQVNYDAVKFMMTETVEKNGFAMWQAVGRIIKALGNKQLKQRMFEIADILKQKPECIIDNYRFQLVYNIGVLKKVKCEYVL